MTESDEDGVVLAQTVGVELILQPLILVGTDGNHGNKCAGVARIGNVASFHYAGGGVVCPETHMHLAGIQVHFGHHNQIVVTKIVAAGTSMGVVRVDIWVYGTIAVVGLQHIETGHAVVGLETFGVGSIKCHARREERRRNGKGTVATGADSSDTDIIGRAGSELAQRVRTGDIDGLVAIQGESIGTGIACPAEGGRGAVGNDGQVRRRRADSERARHRGEGGFRNKVVGPGGRIVGIDTATGGIHAYESGIVVRGRRRGDVHQQAAAMIGEALGELEQNAVGSTVYNAGPHSGHRHIQQCSDALLAHFGQAQGHRRAPRSSVRRRHVEADTLETVARQGGKHRRRIKNLVVLCSINPGTVNRQIGVRCGAVGYHKAFRLRTASQWHCQQQRHGRNL